MIFKNITLNNFLSYYSENIIEFSPMTTIFIGQNNTGKSKLFDAINFALYGRIFPTDKGTNGEWTNDIREISNFVLNSNAKKIGLQEECPKIESKVKLLIDMSKFDLIIERKIIYQKDGDDFVYAANAFSVTELDQLDGHEIYSGILSDAENRLSMYFSPSIQDYFLFQGEAASKIMQLHKGGNFSKAVRELARLVLFEDAKLIAEDYTRHVNNLLSRRLTKSKEAQEKQDRLNRQIEALTTSLNDYVQKRDDAEKAKDDYADKIDQIEKKLSQYKEFEDWLKRKKDLEKDIKRLSDDLKEANQEKTEIAEDAVFYKVNKKIESFKSFYSELEAKGEVPPSIPAAEIKKALEYHRCTICNTDLSEGSPAREFALKRLPKCDTDKLGDYLRTLNLVFGEMNESVQQTPQKLKKIIERKQKLEDKKVRLSKEKENLEDELHQMEAEVGSSAARMKEIDETKRTYNNYKNLYDRAKTEYDRNSALADITRQKLTDYQSQQILFIGSVAGLTERDRTWSRYAAKLSEAMVRMYDIACTTAYGKVQEKADKFYQDMTKNNSGLVGKIKIDTQNSEIYTIDENGDRIRNINQGNRISIQLAVIAGILNVAQEEFGQQYPFVTDAPVSALGGDNKLSTIQTMIDAFEQSIVIIKDDSSSQNKNNDEIRELIDKNKYVGMVYELSMSSANSKTEQFTIINRIKG